MAPSTVVLVSTLEDRPSRECQIRRGTRHPDGSLIRGLIPGSPGSRRVRDLWKGDGCGPFEAKAIELVATGREVDAVLAMIGRAQATIADAKAEEQRAFVVSQGGAQRACDASVQAIRGWSRKPLPAVPSVGSSNLPPPLAKPILDLLGRLD